MAYCYHPTNFGKEAKKQMNMDREFTAFDDEMSWRKRKRFQLLDTNDFRRAMFTLAERIEKFSN